MYVHWLHRLEPHKQTSEQSSKIYQVTTRPGLLSLLLQPTASEMSKNVKLTALPNPPNIRPNANDARADLELANAGAIA